MQGTNAQVNLYWTAPDDGGQDITSYRVEVSEQEELLAQFHDILWLLTPTSMR